VTGVRRAGRTLQRLTRRAADETVVDRAARAGLAARGVVFVLLAYLIGRIASGALGTGSTGKSASGTGVAQAVAAQPGGRPVLFVLAIGLLCYALFSLLDALVHHRESSDFQRWGNRALSLWGFLLYGVFSGFAFATATSGTGNAGSSQHQDQQQAQLSARILRWPAGWLWLALIALVLFVIAGFLAARGIRRTFRDPLHQEAMSSREWTVATVLGVAGCFGRAALFAITGAFVASAALEDDPSHGQGVNGAARQLANTIPGQALLWAVAVCVLAFGGYLGFEARYRRV
jgi:hypothetical protein